MFEKRCDQVTIFCFYAMIFFLPIAPAIIEGLFVVILLAYLLKRGVRFFHSVKNLESQERTDPFKVLQCFLSAYQPVNNPLNHALSIYVFVAFLSVLLTSYTMVSFKGFVFKLLQGVFTYFLFVEVINTKKRLKIFSGILLTSLTLIVTNGIFQYIVREGFIHHHPVTDGRITSSFRHGNDFSGYLVVLLPALIAFIGGYLFYRKKKIKMVPIIILFALALVCFGLTYSRGAWVALIVSFLFLGFKKPKILMFLSIFLLVFFVVFAPKMMKERTTNVGNINGMVDDSSRFMYWRSGMKVVNEHPVFGVGLNAYSLFARDYPGEMGWRGYPHNCFLQITAELGFIGLAAFLFIIYKISEFVFISLRHIEDGLIRNLLLGSLAGFYGFLAHGFFDTTFYSTQLDALMWLTLGFIVSLARIYQKTA